MKKTIYPFIFSMCILACKKEKISEQHPELIGTWRELNGTDNYAKLEIRSESKGTLYDCHTDDCGDIQLRKWRIKNDHLYYGLTNDLGEITQYPTKALSDIVIGETDTIKSGDRYIILNHNYYLDITY